MIIIARLAGDKPVMKGNACLRVRAQPALYFSRQILLDALRKVKSEHENTASTNDAKQTKKVKTQGKTLKFCLLTIALVLLYTISHKPGATSPRFELG